MTLGSAWLVIFSLFILFQCVSPLLPVLISEFRLNHWMGGFLYSLPLLMIALFSYPLGVLSDRIGLEVAVGCGVIVATLFSLIRALATDYYILAFSTAIFGLGFAMCFTNLPKLVKTNFPQRLAGTATGAYTTAIPLGAGLGIALTKPVFAMTGGWREVLMIWSVMAIPAIVFWWVVAGWCRKRRRPSHLGSLHQETVPQAPSQGTAREDSADARQPLHPSSQKGRSTQRPMSDIRGTYSRGGLLGSVLLCGSLLLLLNLMFYATIGWLPTYLTEAGWDAVSAAAATSVISFVEIPAVLLVPVLSDRTGRRTLILILGFSLISICSASLAFNTDSSWFVAPLLGTTFGGIFALLLAMPVELVEQEKVASVAGAIISIGYVGALTGPIITGYLRDLTGNFVAGFLVVALAGLVSVALSYALSAVQPQRSPTSADEKEAT